MILLASTGRAALDIGDVRKTIRPTAEPINSRHTEFALCLQTGLVMPCAASLNDSAVESNTDAGLCMPVQRIHCIKRNMSESYTSPHLRFIPSCTTKQKRIAERDCDGLVRSILRHVPRMLACAPLGRLIVLDTYPLVSSLRVPRRPFWTGVRHPNTSLNEIWARIHTQNTRALK